VASTAHGQTPITTVENGNGDARLQLNYDGGFSVPGDYINAFNERGTPNDSIPATGAGTRLMWYPAKAAFRAGQVGLNRDGTQWDAAKVGTHSVALGLDPKASGIASIALGDATVASDGGAVARGKRLPPAARGLRRSATRRPRRLPIPSPSARATTRTRAPR
jgi:hypothetical protein